MAQCDPSRRAHRRAPESLRLEFAAQVELGLAPDIDLLGRLWDCIDPLPQSVCEDLGLELGSTYANAARKLCDAVGFRHPAEQCADTAMNEILVVEDDDDLRDILCQVLADEGFVTQAARNGNEALSLLAEAAAPGLILLDLMMPVMNGWVFRSRQEADPRLATIPVIVMSATELLDDAAIVGADHLRKPVRLEQLVDRVRAHLPPDGAVAGALDVGGSSPTG
jgi:CheY-like chemotaxis protein